MDPSFVRDQATGSWLKLRFAQRATLVILVLTAGVLPLDRNLSDRESRSFIAQVTDRWCRDHKTREDMQVVQIVVHFRPQPPLFAEGEGVVVAPLSLDLPGAQRLVDFASQPGHLRTLKARSITALAWEYAGRANREMRFMGAALVQRTPRTVVRPPDKPTFVTLDADLRPEALANARDLEEHGLHKCADFPAWARRVAGDPPYTAQVLRLVKGVGQRPGKSESSGEDVCAATRSGVFTPHWAQVAVVMAAREIGIPAFGFSSASPRQIFLVGTYTDQNGWILIDIEQPEQGWFSGGAPLITMAPLIGEFPASQHSYWYAEGAAYASGPMGIMPLSRTTWKGQLESGAKPTDTTEALSFPLEEACR